MRKAAVAGVGLGVLIGALAQAGEVRCLTVKDYLDKMKAGWIGQMAGVGWGGPTEFRSKGKIIPEDKMPKWNPGLINQFNQDDIYVEMTFLRTLEEHGFDAPIRQAGIDFANSGYPLWHANKAGRDNLRRGIAPPDSGHPQFNSHADDIDYQIESDYSGLIAPGLPQVAIELGEKFGRLMNYGDGLYGGQLFGGMYAEAFFESDPVKIVEAGLKCIPAGSQYAECIRDVLAWHKESPKDWVETWKRVNEKYQENADYRKASCNKGDFNIDAKINGAYVVMGVLYGERDLDQTIIISTRCGQDSDCNPSSSAGVVFTTVGFEKLPDKFKSALNPEGKFSHTPYNFPTLIAVCEKLARQAVVRAGGKIEKDAKGEETFLIPVQAPKPTALEQCWTPGPVANSRFTDEEMAKITAPGGARGMKEAAEKFAPGWMVANCGDAEAPGLRAEWGGKRNVLVTHPLNQTNACVLSRKVEVPPLKKTTVRLVVGHDPRGDWELIVRADNREILRKEVGKSTAYGGWLEARADLSAYGGRTVLVELLNSANGWRFETGFWAKIDIVSE
ncbi:MAG: ADP-ribosylglycohydrolase family protein [Planctomycetes bacterium]|nr:ADP-ribosylglycohydrolase family protein [Planctomycetota bacterium]